MQEEPLGYWCFLQPMECQYLYAGTAFLRNWPIGVQDGNFRQRHGACPLYEVFWKSAAIVEVQAVKYEISPKLCHLLLPVVAL